MVPDSESGTEPPPLNAQTAAPARPTAVTAAAVRFGNDMIAPGLGISRTDRLSAASGRCSFSHGTQGRGTRFPSFSQFLVASGPMSLTSRRAPLCDDEDPITL